MKQLNFDPVKKAGITQEEFGTLLSVSRVSVNGWIAGKFNVHPMRYPRVDRLLKALNQAVRDGALPVAVNSRDKRMPAVKRVLVTYLRQPTQ